MKKDRGFTLVELVVVIAILGILAGVAVPVYSGYVKKAHQAADNQLLGAVNTAFAAASMEAGQYDGKPSGGRATLAADGKVQSVVSTVDADGSLFAKYFAGNENSAFGFYRSIVYNKKTGSFSGNDYKVTNNGNGTFTFEDSKGKSITVNETDIDNVGGSTFGTNMSVTDLGNEVNNVVQAASSVLGNIKSLTNGLEGFNDMLSDMNVDPEKATNEELANALVLYVARNTSSATTTKLFDAIGGGGMSALIDTSDMGGTLSTMALAYGMMTGYANSDLGKTSTIEKNGETLTVKEYFDKTSAGLSDSEGGTAGLLAVLTMMGDMSTSSGFNDYVTTQAGKDAAGYVSAMNMISTNYKNLDASSYLRQGLAGSYMNELLSAVFGG